MDKPQVALESAVITHGLPRPLNLEVAMECEEMVRQAGANPATVCVFRGRVCVGMSAGEMERLAADPAAYKCAARDIGAVVAAGLNGGTTVSGTLAIAARAGIAVMSTGGIGGVHRGEGGDVSADLQQLTRSAVTVVCTGAKAILDVPRTLEALDTMGVPVLGYGTKEFPAFYTKETGLRVTHGVDTVKQAARAIRAYRDTGYSGGILVVQPPPISMPAKDLEEVLAQSLVCAVEQGIRGADVTPFLLASLADASGGRTLEINRKLLAANATLAGQIACALTAS